LAWVWLVVGCLLPEGKLMSRSVGIALPISPAISIRGEDGTKLIAMERNSFRR